MKPENGYSFNSQEEEALKQFLSRCPSISHSSAVKFLSARKFNVERAVELLRNHETVRHREELTNFQPTLSPLREELETAKFTVLPWRDSQGAAITMFTASRHSPSTSSHRTTLQGVVYQLDVALENPLTQRDGIVFVYNMSASRYEHFDYELCQKILQLLKGAYPARLKKVLIVSAPLWFRAPFKILRLFVREKLRDRVMIVSQAQLVAHIPPSSLPVELGGTQTDHDHHAWLLHCLKVHNQNFLNQTGLDDHIATEKLIELDEGSDDICSRENNGGQKMAANGNGAAFQQTQDKNGVQNGNNQVTPEREELAEEEGDDNSLVSANSIHVVPLPPPVVPTCPFQPTGPVSGVPHVHHVPTEIVAPPIPSVRTPPELEPPKDMTMEEFILDLQRKGRRGLCREYSEIKSRLPAGTFDAARDKLNQSKNRYTDVLCLDHSRVKLSVSSFDAENSVEDEATDYINANYVDGYKMSKAFISTQGPLPRTFGDFWKMIWEEKCGVIVMTTRCIERTRTKCGQYWPATEGEEHEHGEFRIANMGVEAAGDYQVTELQVCSRDCEDEFSTRTIWHLQFLSWPDYGVPESAFAMLSFRDVCLQKQRETLKELRDRLLWDSFDHGPPIVVHCSAGIGRTGTFITLDTCIRRLEAESMINVRETVEDIRSQRAFSIQMPDQYVFCHLALLEYALIHGHLKDVDLSGFDDSSDESPEDH